MAGFSAEAQAQISSIVALELAKALANPPSVAASGNPAVAAVEALGNVLLHGQLPTDEPEQPSRVGLDQLDARLEVLTAEIEDLRAILRGGQLTFSAGPSAGSVQPQISITQEPVSPDSMEKVARVTGAVGKSGGVSK